MTSVGKVVTLPVVRIETEGWLRQERPKMPAVGPQLRVPNTSSIDEHGRPICVMCEKRLRAQFGGYGYNGSGHFCTKTCAAEWADLKVESVT